MLFQANGIQTGLYLIWKTTNRNQYSYDVTQFKAHIAHAVFDVNSYHSYDFTLLLDKYLRRHRMLKQFCTSNFMILFDNIFSMLFQRRTIIGQKDIF